MGVPALFRWLSRKYPKIVTSVIEDENANDINSETGVSNFDMSQINPNGEADCLYLDMNGIVHPCTHPEGKKAPETEEDMMVEVFKYTERVVNMVRPRKLLFLAIDGVAPRAKMNQQRSRRFRAAQEAKVKEEERQEAILEWQARGQPLSENFTKEKAWDSNAITPGTPFMDKLSMCLKYWIVKKMNTCRGWQNLQVILSDASVPGEGEHKIMDFIRRQRSYPEHDPNTRHVIYGLDADLIMLSLATHEPHFRVLREDVFAQSNKPRGCHRCGQPGHHSSMCTAPPKEKEVSKTPELKPFIFLDVSVLREYLEIELNMPGLSFPFDLERAIDDWVFLIFFVGNDFLPHLPSLEIREGAIDTLMHIWRTALPRLSGYVTEHGQVNLSHLQEILTGLAAREDGIFAKRKEAEERQDRAEKRRRIGLGADHDNGQPEYVAVRAPPPVRPSTPPPPPIDRQAVKDANLSAAQKLKRELMGLPADEATPPAATETPAIGDEASGHRGQKRKADDVDVSQQSSASALENGSGTSTPAVPVDDDDEEAGEDSFTQTSSPTKQLPPPLKMMGDNVVEQEDTVKLWEPGYRERYYRQKFGVELSDTDFRRKLVKSYVEGLCWVLAYYYQGCPSWQWYYPEHFSPFAADFEDLASLDIKFDLGQPFKPFEQLMGVFPADSRSHIPEPYHPLMTEDDSPIKDFYPSEFHIDMNGKKMLWQGVALLPFIDQTRLQNALDPLVDQLSDDEKHRNAPGIDYHYSHEEGPLYPQVSQLYTQQSNAEENVPLEWRRSNRIFGYIHKDPECVPGSTFFSPLHLDGQIDIDNDKTVSALYTFPDQRVPHRSMLLPGAKPVRGALNSHDMEVTRRGGNPDSRPTSSFHGSRRDIDNSGHRGYNSQPRSYNQSGGYGYGRDAYAGYSNQPSYPSSSHYNNTNGSYGRQQQPPPQTFQRPARYEPPPMPLVNLPTPSYNNNPGGYRLPPQRSSQPYLPPDSYPGYGAPSPYQNYGAPQAIPQYRPPPSLSTFSNHQAVNRNLPLHLQAPQPPNPAYQSGNYNGNYRR